ncbi:MAG TPA: tRNA (adenosine(37)-N6)-threonylcarbamoyltransferase complex dimerization subunit type 1 TsaB [Bacillota bacterium]
MLILGLDTATPWGTLALWEDGEVVAEAGLKTGKGGGEYLLDLLGTMIQKSGREFRKIDLIAVGTGPGSFTGIRVGLAAVKGIAAGIERPVFGLSTLRVIAENARYIPVTYIATVLDARRERVYAALYRKSDGEILECLKMPQVMAATEFARQLAAYSGTVICGDGCKKYRSIWELVPGLMIGPEEWARPSAGKLAAIAFRDWDRRTSVLSELTPFYLGKVEAEARLEEGLNATGDQPDASRRFGRSIED